MKLESMIIRINTQEEWDIVTGFYSKETTCFKDAKKCNYIRIDYDGLFGDNYGFCDDINIYRYLNIISFNIWKTKVKQEDKNMTKADLKVNMIVELRNGIKYIIHNFENELVLISKETHDTLNNYTNNLLSNNPSLITKFWDIIKVFKPTNPYYLMIENWDNAELIWEREDIVEVDVSTLISEYEKNHNVKIKVTK